MQQFGMYPGMLLNHIIRGHFGAKNNNDWIHFIKLHKNLIIFLRIIVGIEFVDCPFGDAERSQSQDSLWKVRPQTCTSGKGNKKCSKNDFKTYKKKDKRH